MKIISVHSKRDTVRSSDADISARITDTGIALGFLTFLRTGSMHARFAGASLTHADAGRNAGGAAMGAVAGGLLLGPLGALAGAAMGGRKTHTLVLNSPDARVVFEATGSEFQTLLGFGLPADTRVEPEAEHLPKLGIRFWVIPGAALAGVLTLMAVMRSGDDKQQSTGAIPTAAVTAAPATASVPKASKALSAAKQVAGKPVDKKPGEAKKQGTGTGVKKKAGGAPTATRAAEPTSL